MDQVASLGLLAILFVLWAAHALRARAGAAVTIERVELEGESALLSRGLLESLYGAIVPIGRVIARTGLAPNAISCLSVLLALAAGAWLAVGHLGVGCVFAVAAMGCDALDGFVARCTGMATSSGEVVDSAADRYVELALFTGLAIELRAEPSALLLTLAALGGSFMVSYSTAKAEALAIVPPRGSMRRTERGFVLILGIGLTPLTAALSLPPLLRGAPLLIALLWLAVGTHISAISRFAYVARELRLRNEAVPPVVPHTLPVDR
jgi:phosphatidylglycerophosphate synthase